MATITVNNLSADPNGLYLSDLYATIPFGGSLSFERFPAEIGLLRSVMEAVNNQLATMSVVYTADEIGSGFAVGGSAPVAASSVQGGPLILRVLIPASPTLDTTIYAAGDLPANIRILDHSINITTAGAGAVEINDELLSASPAVPYLTVSSAAVGPIKDVALLGGQIVGSSPRVARGTTKGLFVYRSNALVACEVVLTCRTEL